MIISCVKTQDRNLEFKEERWGFLRSSYFPIWGAKIKVTKKRE
jgi:hypothetical protein